MSPCALVSLLLPCTVLSLPTPADEDTQFYLRLTEMEIVRCTNEERIRYGLSPLKVDLQLVESARDHGSWMAGRQTLQHTSAMVGENIAMGQATAAEAVRDWMNSPGHRANILNGTYTRIGVAAYVAPNGTIYWCQQFLY
ncbi:MAG: hypothetical protein KDA42_01345 [Planctomycetales bacterium]|nr:hypothetical protein [Planctomycetales bacterium]